MNIYPFTKTYQSRRVLSFPGFAFQDGKIYAIIGANGSGKSTFAKIISAILKPDSSAHALFDQTPSIGYLPQKPYAFHMSLKKNLLLNASADKKSSQKRAEDLMTAFQLTHLSDSRATALSGGETARMCLARLMMRSYSLLVLDEPCAAMDIEATLQTESLIRQYCQETNCCCLVITHSLAQAQRLSDEVLFFHQGNLVETGETSRLLQHPSHPETRRFLEFYGQQTGETSSIKTL